jgi:hypothetical protein
MDVALPANRDHGSPESHPELNAFCLQIHSDLQFHMLDHWFINFQPFFLQRCEAVRRHLDAPVLCLPALPVMQ